MLALADRGFGDTELYGLLGELDFQCVIRFRGEITMTTADGRTGKAREFLAADGEATRFDDVRLTQHGRPAPSAVAVRDTGMKDAWFLATDVRGSAQRVVGLYGRRFTIEETLCDAKDGHFGKGLSQTHIGTPARRDRLLLPAAIAQVHLTFQGRAGEQLGLDRQLRANTQSVRRTHPLFRHGRDCRRGLFARWQEQLTAAYLELLRAHECEASEMGWIWGEPSGARPRWAGTG